MQKIMDGEGAPSTCRSLSTLAHKFKDISECVHRHLCSRFSWLWITFDKSTNALLLTCSQTVSSATPVRHPAPSPRDAGTPLSLGNDLCPSRERWKGKGFVVAEPPQLTCLHLPVSGGRQPRAIFAPTRNMSNAASLKSELCLWPQGLGFCFQTLKQHPVPHMARCASNLSAERCSHSRQWCRRWRWPRRCFKEKLFFLFFTILTAAHMHLLLLLRQF